MEIGQSEWTVSDLHDAIYTGAVVKARACLSGGISPEASIEGVTPLFVAASLGQLKMVDLLVAAGARVNQVMPGICRSTKLHTALNGAALHGKLACVDRLLEYGADPRIVDYFKRSPAQLIMGDTRPRRLAPEQAVEACRVLGRMFDTGLAVNRSDEQGQTALHAAVRQKAPASVLIYLLDRQADPYRFDDSGWAPLHYACNVTSEEQFNALVAKGVDVNFQTMTNGAPLHFSSAPQDFDLIMKADPDLEAQDQLGRTPLARALQGWGTTIAAHKVSRLVVAGASLDTPDHEGIKPRDLIRQKGLTHIAALAAAREAQQAIARIGAARRQLGPA